MTEQELNKTKTETKVKQLPTHTHPTKRKHFLDVSVLFCPAHIQ